MLCQPKLYLPFCSTNFLSRTRSRSPVLRIQVNTNFISNPHLNRAFFSFSLGQNIFYMCCAWCDISCCFTIPTSQNTQIIIESNFTCTYRSPYISALTLMCRRSHQLEKRMSFKLETHRWVSVFITMTAGWGIAMIFVCPYFHKILCWQKLGQDCLFLHWIYRRRRHTGRRKYFVK